MALIFLAFVISFVIVVFFTPSLIKVAQLKGLIDKPDEDRKLHKGEIPTIGGIMIFAGTLFAYTLTYPIIYMQTFKYEVACMLILFFVGIKDDIIGTAPIKKLAAHVLVAMILVLMANIKITSLHGVLNVYELPEGISIFLSIFTIIVIVNAFNLIDGVDGLAAGVGSIVSVAFGCWFYQAGNEVLSCFSFSLAGSLFGFLGFNFSPARIFMGDSGSLTIGLIISILALQLIEYEKSYNLPEPLDIISKPAFVIAALIYPLYDTLRIFIYRAVRGISPFSADRNHIHHRLQDIGLNHRQVVLVIYLINIGAISVSIALQMFEPSIQFFGVIAASFIFFQIPFLYKTKRFQF
jgi:UDP-N-acetylmuramyl pentapeptide phosphotransferase/UDP-N-acetylglucosamine-1-phosphate transferase